MQNKLYKIVKLNFNKNQKKKIKKIKKYKIWQIFLQYVIIIWHMKRNNILIMKLLMFNMKNVQIWPKNLLKKTIFLNLNKLLKISVKDIMIIDKDMRIILLLRSKGVGVRKI